MRSCIGPERRRTVSAACEVYGLALPCFVQDETNSWKTKYTGSVEAQ